MRVAPGAGVVCSQVCHCHRDFVDRPVSSGEFVSAEVL